jgi:hypothetical protein
MIATLSALVIVFALAFFAEGFMEYLVMPLIQWLALKLKVKPDQVPKYASAAIGVGLSFYYRLDIIALLAKMAGDEAHAGLTTLGIIITGVLMGRGSNYLHQFVSKFFPPKVG